MTQTQMVFQYTIISKLYEFSINSELNNILPGTCKITHIDAHIVRTLQKKDTNCNEQHDWCHLWNTEYLSFWSA